ncbi:DUF2946 domain-containing protein [Herbaspirillum sp. HC18]|nr:DUF2946 domain-containing protein [Herbaspirillum sp. HC18]
MNKFTRRITAWIASFAILLAAFAPLISHAMSNAANAGKGWVQVCSHAGTKMVKVDSKLDPTAPAEKGVKANHCPFCITHADSFGFPPTAGFALPAPDAEQSLPILYYQSPRPLFIWTAAHSRAPPVVS